MQKFLVNIQNINEAQRSIDQSNSEFFFIFLLFFICLGVMPLIEIMISATCRKRLIVTKNVLQEIRSMRFKYEAIFYRRVRFYKFTSVCLGFLLIRFLTEHSTWQYWVRCTGHCQTVWTKKGSLDWCLNISFVVGKCEKKEGVFFHPNKYCCFFILSTKYELFPFLQSKGSLKFKLFVCKNF